MILGEKSCEECRHLLVCWLRRKVEATHEDLANMCLHYLGVETLAPGGRSSKIGE